MFIIENIYLKIHKRKCLFNVKNKTKTLALSVQKSIEQIQLVLNSTEVGLHQLTALVNCRSLHMVSHCLLFLMTAIQFSLPSWLPSFLGLCPGIDRAVLWWGRRCYLPGSVLLRHCSDVLFNCVQCATYMAKEKVKHTHKLSCWNETFPLDNVAWFICQRWYATWWRVWVKCWHCWPWHTIKTTGNLGRTGALCK